MIDNEDILLAQQGDVESIEKIVTKYRNILAYNNKLFLKGAEKEDLIQEGMIGLVKAIKSFDESKNSNFNSFASVCIKRQILTAIKNYNSGKNKNLNLAMQNIGYSEIAEFIKYSNPSMNYHNPEQLLLGKELLVLLIEFLEKNLSHLEKIVFSYMIKGYGYIDIAEILNKSPKTIDNSFQRIKKKSLSFLKMYNKQTKL